MELPEIVGIAGTNGAGKDTFAELLAAALNYKNTSTSDLLRTELDKKGLPHTRENMRALSTRLRRESGNGVLGTMLIERYFAEKEQAGREGLIITSMRHPAIAEAIKQKGGIVIWVDGDRRARYDRVRLAARGRPDDLVTYEEFYLQEDAEMQPAGGDKNAVNMGGVKEAADIVIENNFPTKEEYERFLAEKFTL